MKNGTKLNSKVLPNQVSFRDLYVQVKSQLAQNGIIEISEADNLICDTLGLKRTELFNLQTISKKQFNKVISVLEKRKERIPLNKILKNQNFYGLDFYINENVLAPRQETEILVEHAIKYIQSLSAKTIKALDMCTGSGVIAICLKKFSKAKVYASDISRQALNVATKNAKTHNVDIQFIKSDGFKDLKQPTKFDIIVSNPPYIPTMDIKKLDDEVRLHDPIIALDGGMDGLSFYREFSTNSPKFLKSGGVIMLEIGFDQFKKVSQILEHNFKDIRLLNDYSGLPRVIIATKKG